MLRRYQRFFADIALEDGRNVTAHCPNTGTMRTCWAPGAPVQLSQSDNPARKLAWTLERVDMGAGWIGVHTGRVNSVIAEAINAERIPALAGYRTLRREVAVALPNLPPGRIDIGLYDGPTANALVEIKNVTLLDGDCLRFPDAVTERGRRHLDLLLAAHQRGQRAVMLYALNRPEGDGFALAREVDPAYAQRLLEVIAAGVECLAVRIHHGTQDLAAGDIVPLRFDL
jgi:sugar fermentation stimulation protein A